MDSPIQPPQTTDDLAQTDAKAFLESNSLPSEEKPTNAANPPNLTSEAPQDPNAARIVQIQIVKTRPIAIYVVVAVALAIIVTLALIHSTKQGQANTNTTNSSGGALSVPTPDNSDTKGLSSQAQQDIKSCSSVVTAVAGGC